MIPFGGFFQVEKGKGHENSQRDHFLDGFKLEGGELAVTDPVGRHHKTILEKSDQPAE